MELRLKAIAVAQSRVRTAFFLILIASSTISLTVYYSAMTRKAYYRYFHSLDEAPDQAKDWWQQEIYKEELKADMASRTYTIPLLGVSVRVEDLSFLGPAALLVLFYYYAAASKLALSQIERLSRNYPTELRDREYASVSLSSGMLLNTADIYLPYSTSSGYSIRAARFGWRAVASAYRVLIFFPVVVAVACLFTDSQVLMKTEPLCERLFTQAPFRLCGLMFSILLFFFAITVTQNNKAIRENYMRIERMLGQSDVT